MTQPERYVSAGLVTLILLQIIMLSALYAGIKPHPPVATPIFGIAPFLGASVCLAVSALIVQPLSTTIGQSLSILASLMALVSFGPQKFFDAQFALIWPAVVLGQIAAVVVLAQVVGAIRMRSQIELPATQTGGQA